MNLKNNTKSAKLVEIIAEEEEMIDINCGTNDKDNKNNGNKLMFSL